MFSEEFSQNFSRQMSELWIQPELEARRAAGLIPADFVLQRCLILLPPNAKPVVQFNDEIVWRVKAKLPEGRVASSGDLLNLQDVERIETVAPPTFLGQRVAFVYAHWVNGTFHVFFDLVPNNPEMAAKEEGKPWSFAEPLAHTLQASLVEQALQLHQAVQPDLVKIGLWAAPSLLPYPISQIVAFIKVGDEAKGRQLLIDHCKGDWLAEMVKEWWSVKYLTDRRLPIEQALAAHRNEQYCLTISTLLPHIEGIVTDWLHANDKNVPFRQESKTKRFLELITSDSRHTPAFKGVADSAGEFILDGPVLATFRQWFDSFDTTFPNRNVVGHGRYDERVYTEENSIKIFLMLDTVFQMIAVEEAIRKNHSELVQQSESILADAVSSEGEGNE